MKLTFPALLLCMVLAACSGQPSQGPAYTAQTATPSSAPAASPSQSSPAAQAASFGVLVTAPSAATYTVTLVGTDGHVAGTAQASGFGGALTCAGIASAVLPLPISTSNTRVYFMDNVGVVHYMNTQGQTGTIATLPHGNGVRSMFAVSPDDKRMSVVVSTFSATSAHSTLYLYDLVAEMLTTVYTQTSPSGLWPIGWHGGSLVLGITHACTTGSAFGCCSPYELHLVDPVTAVRRFTIAGGSCTIAGPSASAGTPCMDRTTQTVYVRDWVNVRLMSAPLNGAPVYLSPDGKRLVSPVQSNGDALLVRGDGKTPAMGVCGWIDGDTILAGGDVNTQPRVGSFVTGQVTPVAAQGECAGRIPGAL